MSQDSPISNLNFDGFARLDHLGVIEASGADAVSFLHGQLTQDLALLDMQHARLAALCSAKGRMLASFILFKASPERVLLLCSRDILAATVKRLSMFVLRAKCKLADVSDQFHIVAAAGNVFEQTGLSAKEAWLVSRQDHATWISLYPANQSARALGLLNADAPLPTFNLTAQSWQLSEVLSGVATLTQPVVEAFVPQMLNYESVGGVNFKKGCYPGQEVVARSQFRGTLKRRACIVQSKAPLSVGQEVYSATDPEQPCGLVAQAASVDATNCAIVSLQVSAMETPLHAGSIDGPALALIDLPYPLIEI